MHESRRYFVGKRIGLVSFDLTTVWSEKNLACNSFVYGLKISFVRSTHKQRTDDLNGAEKFFCSVGTLREDGRSEKLLKTFLSLGRSYRPVMKQKRSHRFVPLEIIEMWCGFAWVSFDYFFNFFYIQVCSSKWIAFCSGQCLETFSSDWSTIIPVFKFSALDIDSNLG